VYAKIADVNHEQILKKLKKAAIVRHELHELARIICKF
jgi:hypothetical protein